MAFSKSQSRPLWSLASDAHQMIRQSQMIGRGLLLLSLLATIALLVTYPRAAWVAAIPIPVLYATLAIAKYYERLSCPEMLRRSGAQNVSAEEHDLDLEVAGVTTVFKVLTLLALGCLIIAASFFELALVGILAAACFFLTVLIELPYLFLFFSEAKREEDEKLARATAQHTTRPRETPGRGIQSATRSDGTARRKDEPTAEGDKASAGDHPG